VVLKGKICSEPSEKTVGAGKQQEGKWETRVGEVRWKISVRGVRAILGSREDGSKKGDRNCVVKRNRSANAGHWLIEKIRIQVLQTSGTIPRTTREKESGV